MGQTVALSQMILRTTHSGRRFSKTGRPRDFVWLLSDCIPQNQLLLPELPWVRRLFTAGFGKIRPSRLLFGVFECNHHY